MAAFADIGTSSPRQLQALRDAAHARGVELSIHQVAKAEEIAPAIDAAKASNAAALNILASPLLFANRKIIIERAATLRLPAGYQWPEVAEEGGFIGYGPRLVQLFRDLLARQFIKILRGAKPLICPSSSRRTSSWSSICGPRRRLVTRFPPGSCCAPTR